MTETVFKF